MMFWISRNKFVALLEESYQKGESGCADLGEEFFQDLLLKAKSGKLNFKMHSVIDIQKFPIGKRIIHPVLGEGEVCVDSGKSFVVFLNRSEVVNQENSNFWSYPICVLSNNNANPRN